MPDEGRIQQSLTESGAETPSPSPRRIGPMVRILVIVAIVLAALFVGGALGIRIIAPGFDLFRF